MPMHARHCSKHLEPKPCRASPALWSRRYDLEGARRAGFRALKVERHDGEGAGLGLVLRWLEREKITACGSIP